MKPHNGLFQSSMAWLQSRKNIYHSFHLMPKIHNDLQNLLLVIAAELRTVENDDIRVTKSNL